MAMRLYTYEELAESLSSIGFQSVGESVSSGRQEVFRNGAGKTFVVPIIAEGYADYEYDAILCHFRGLQHAHENIAKKSYAALSPKPKLVGGKKAD